MQDGGLINTIRRRKHVLIRLTKIIVKALPVEGLVLSWIRMSPVVSDVGCMHGVFRGYIRKTSACLPHNMQAEVPGTRRSAVLPAWASTFQQDCLWLWAWGV